MRAHKPLLQPVVDAIQAYLQEHNMLQKEMAAMIYGYHANGEPKATNFNPTATGRNSPRMETVALIKDKTGLDLAPVVAMISNPARSQRTPVKAALEDFAAAQRSHGPAASEGRAGQATNARVTLTVTRPSGEVVLSLADVTAEQATKLLQTLISAGLA